MRSIHSDGARRAADDGPQPGGGRPPEAPTASSFDPHSIPHSPEPRIDGARFPDRLGKLQLNLGKRNRGGMGIVFEAWHQEIGRVAVKFVRPEFRGHADTASRDRFLAEARLVAQMSNPWIVKIHDVDSVEIDGVVTPYYSMEFIPEARTLTDYASERNLSLSDRIALMSKVCEGVQHAHFKGVVHRDLKPSNILVDGDGHPRIIDFGVAHAAGISGTGNTQGPMGTLGYMSPEQAVGTDADARSDVYSLGVILFELLTGQMPIEIPSSGGDPYRRVAAATPRTLESVDPSLPRALGDVIQKALAKSRQDRFQSVHEFRRAMEAAIQPQLSHDHATSSSSVPRVVWSRLWARRIAAWGVASVVAVGVGTLVPNSVTPRAASSSLASAATRDVPLDPVRLIAMTEDIDPEALIREIKPDATPQELQFKYRTLVAATLRAIQDAAPASVAIDYTFLGASDVDAALFDAAAELKRRGVPVIFAAAPLWFGSTPLPIFGTNAPRLNALTAGISCGTYGEETVRLDLAVKRGEEVRIGLALAAFATARRPDCVPQVDMSEAGTATLRYERIDASGVRTMAKESLLMTNIATLSNDDASGTTGLLPGDQVASLQVALPDEASFSAITMSIKDIVKATPDRLHERLAGRVVIIGDQSKNPDGTWRDVFEFRGRNEFATRLHVLGVAQLYMRLAARIPNPLAAITLILAGAATGVVMGTLGRVSKFTDAHRLRRWGTWDPCRVAVVLGTLFLAWPLARILAEQTLWILVPLPLQIALTLGAAFGWWWTRAVARTPERASSRVAVPEHAR